jgi:DNA polymerase III subunit alpha
LVDDQLIIVDGDISLDEFSNSVRITSRELMTIDEARARSVKYLQAYLPIDVQIDTNQFAQLLNEHGSGDCPILLRHVKDGIQTDIRLGRKWQIKPSDDILIRLQELFAFEKVEFVY